MTLEPAEPLAELAVGRPDFDSEVERFIRHAADAALGIHAAQVHLGNGGSHVRPCDPFTGSHVLRLFSPVGN
jgi:hypothetical protein